MTDLSADSLERLAREHGPFVQRLARALVGGGDAEDLAQDTWVAAASAPLGSVVSPRAWLAGTARRLALHRGRRQSFRRTEELPSEGPGRVPDPEDLVSTLETERSLLRALQELPEPYRTTLWLRYREELPTSEVARAIDAPVSTVRSHLQRGLAQLRVRLANEMGGHARALALILPIAGLRGRAAPAGLAPSGSTGSAVKIAAVGACLALVATCLWVGLRGGGGTGPATIEEATTAQAALDDVGRVSGPSVAPVSKLSERTDAKGGSESQDRSSGVWSLEVRVVDLEGHARAGEWVTLSSVRDGSAVFTPRFQLSGADGVVRFDGLPPGQFEAEPRLSRNGKFVTGGAGDTKQVEIVAGTQVTVQGIVRSPEGRPLAGGVVLGSSTTGSRTGVLLTASDDRGHFSFRLGEPHFFTVSVAGHKASRLFRVGDLELEGEARRVDIVLEPAPLTVSGTVRRPDGEPVVGALVHADVLGDVPPEHWTTARRRSVWTDESGGFALREGLEQGEFVDVQVWADGFVRHRARIEAGSHAELVLDHGRTLDLEVVRVNGEPEAGLHVTIDEGHLRMPGLRNPETWRPNLLTDVEGRVRFERAPRGPLTVVGLRTGFGEAPERALVHVPASDAEVTNVRVELSHFPRIRGRVVDPDGAPVPSHYVTASVQGAGSKGDHDFGSMTDEAGSFVLTNLIVPVPELPLNSPWVLSVLDPEHHNLGVIARIEGVQADDQLVEIQLASRPAEPDAWIVGQFLGEGGAPPTEDMVLTLLDGAGRQPSPHDYDARSGSFRIGPLPAGDYGLLAWDSSDVETSLSGISLAGGETQDVGVLVLGRGGSIHVIPRLDGEAAPSSEDVERLFAAQNLVLEHEHGMLVMMACHGDHWAPSHRIEPGRWTVVQRQARGLAFDRASAEVTMDGHVTVQARVRATREVALEVLGLENVPFSSLSVEAVESGDGAAWSVPITTVGRSEFDGGARPVIELPALSTCRVRVVADSGWRGAASVTLDGRPDGPQVLQIELDEPDD